MIRLPLAPVSRGDPRAGRTWGGRVVSRNRPEYQEWLDAATLLIRSLWSEHGRGFIEGSVELDCVFVIRPPKKCPKALLGQPVAVRPDLDRYVHAIQDAITGAGNVWEDDGRVSRVSAFKRYALEDEAPCVLFSVAPCVEVECLTLVDTTGKTIRRELPPELSRPSVVSNPTSPPLGGDRLAGEGGPVGEILSMRPPKHVKQGGSFR